MSPSKPHRESKAAKSRLRSSLRAASTAARDGADAAGDEPIPEEITQEAHRVLWSAYAGMSTQYEVGRFARRYKPIEADRIAYYLILSWHLLSRNHGLDWKSPVGKALAKLGLWYFQPHFDRLPDHAEDLRKAFTESFCVDPAAFPTDGPGRPAVPGFPELGIQQATLTTTRFRRTARVRLECTVQRAYPNMREMVYPWNWNGCLFWSDLPAPRTVDDFWSEDSLPISVRLPGGSWATRNKQRAVELRVEAVRSPFQTRLDYEGRERGDDECSDASDAGATGASDGDAADVRERGRDSEDRPQANSSRRDVELEGFFGFMLVEKLAGRPGFCRIVFEREGSFGSPNHGYFTEETLGYWITSELITFVEGALRRADRKKKLGAGEENREGEVTA